MNSEEKIYRGASPGPDDIIKLKEKGIRSIVNLQAENSEAKDFVEELGMKFFHIPVIDQRAPTIEQIEEFIEIAGNEENLPLYVHCFAGLERTGTMIACYRIYNGWECERAIDYNLEEVNWPLTEEQKNIVRDYGEIS